MSVMPQGEDIVESHGESQEEFMWVFATVPNTLVFLPGYWPTLQTYGQCDPVAERHG